MPDTGAPPPEDPPTARPGLGWAWLPLVLLLVLFGGILIWLTLPGTRIFPPEPAPRVIDDQRAAALIEESNRALEERARALEEALETAVCRPDGSLVLPDGRLPDGTLPPLLDGEERDPDLPAQSADPLLPPRPDQVQVPGATPGSTSDLLNLIEERTGLVVVQGAAGTGTGSGFFVAPDLFVTNFHVIQPALSGGQVWVTNEALGQVRPAQIVTSRGPLEATGGDYALLRIDGAEQPFYTLRDSTETMRLQSVIAAGYPGAVLETDANFTALVGGDASAIPPATVTDGIVNVEQTLGPETRVLIHTATISPGNSGGPLVDYCGRVVGVNTFGRTADSRQLNFALASTDLIAFLAGAGVTPERTDAACVPNAVGGAPPAPGESDTPPESESE